MKVNSSFRLLQSFVYDINRQLSGVEKLYFKGDKFYLKDGHVIIRKDGVFDLFSYFNNFNLDKWLKYTGINIFFLRLNIAGCFRLRIYRHTTRKCSVIPWYDEIVKPDGWTTIPILLPEQGGILSIKLDAVDDCILYDGGWYTQHIPDIHPSCRIAMIICTFKREDYLLKNLELLKQHLPVNWNAFIIDNGRTLTEEMTSRFDEQFHFFKNPNIGGSGGFTRGLIEVINHEKCWTHVVLMDDDIIIEPSSLVRTDSFLRFLRNEYREYFIGGAMLRLDTPCIQHEASAYWNGICVRRLRHNYDLSNTKIILKNEKFNDKTNQYAAWWYCVIPLSDNIINDLPVPLFSNGDDIEYSMRKARGIILLNGIAVWHQPFHLKYNPVKQYYLSTRNGLIINLRHGYSLFLSLALVHIRLILRLLKGQFAEAKLVVSGLADFLKGPGYLQTINMDELFSKDSWQGLVKEKLRITDITRLSCQLIREYRQLKNAYGNMRLSGDDWLEFINKKTTAIEQ